MDISLSFMYELSLVLKKFRIEFYLRVESEEIF